MKLRRTATVLLATVLGLAGLVVPTAASSASPSHPAAMPARAVAAEPSTTPVIVPAPQTLSVSGDRVALTDPTYLVADASTDAPAIAVVRAAFTAAGITLTDSVSTAAVPAGSTSVRIGASSAADIPALLGATTTPEQAEGYALVVGDGGVVVSGRDTAGQFYGAQTLGQLLAAATARGDDSLDRAKITDFPLMGLRGTIEGFYGTPWSPAQRLAQMDFYGSVKMNTYIYAPKDDPYHREDWREPYPAANLADLRTLVTRATANHVQFTFAISPGNSVCFNSTADRAALLAKFQQVYDLGVRSFSIAFDDIELNRALCAEDVAAYGGSGVAANAQGQRDLLNYAMTDFIQNHPGSRALQTVPTEYYDITTSTYKQNLVAGLDPSVVIMWTGNDVVPRAISNADAEQIAQTWGRKVFLWDNYPTNDFGESAGRLHLAPYDKREAGLHNSLQGIVSNPMNQAQGSRPAVTGVAAFSWNDEAYDARAVWTWAFQQLSGNHAATTAALLTFGDLNHYASTFGSTPWQPQAPRLATLTKPVLDAIAAGTTGPLDLTALRTYAASMEAAPELFAANITDPGFLQEVQPWTTATGLWGQALTASLDGVAAFRENDIAAAQAAFDRARTFSEQAAAVRTGTVNRWTPLQQQPRIGDGVLDVFITAVRGLLDNTLTPAHYWPLDEATGQGVTDEVGDLDGTRTATGTGYTTGKVDQALSFDGSTSGITLTGGTELEAPWTAGMWVRRTGDTSSSTLFGGPSSAVKLEQFDGTHALGATVFEVADEATGHITPLGDWEYITVVGDRTATTFYAQGRQVGQVARSVDLGLQSIGQVTGKTYTDRIKADLDDVVVYRGAMNAAQVGQLYTAAQAGDGSVLKIGQPADVDSVTFAQVEKTTVARGEVVAVQVFVLAQTTPVGRVEIRDGTTVVAERALTASQNGTIRDLAVSGLAVGRHSLTAHFLPALGNTVRSSSSTTTEVTIVRATPSISAELATEETSTGSRPLVQVVVSALGLVPSGTVRILEGDTVLATGTLTGRSGRILITLPRFAVGKHVLTAEYSGSADVLPRTSDPLEFVVARTVATVTASYPAPEVRTSTSVRLTVSVGAGALIPVGSITISDNCRAVRKVELAADARGRIVIDLGRLTAGRHSLTAQFNGTTQIATGVSRPVSVTVRKVAATVSSRLSATTVPANRAASLAVSVRAPGFVPTGTVAVLVDGRQRTVVTLRAADRGIVRIVLPRLPVGSHRVQAVYSGSSTVDRAAGPALRLLVTR